MNSFSTRHISTNAVLSSYGCSTAFFIDSWRRCCPSLLKARPVGQRKSTAMRDQNFQQLMSAIKNEPLQDNIPDSGRSEVLSSIPVGESKPSITEELDSQIAFKQFLKRSLPNRKPSSEFIKSIQDRIKIIDTSDSAI